MCEFSYLISLSFQGSINLQQNLQGLFIFKYFWLIIITKTDNFLKNGMEYYLFLNLSS